MRCYCDFFATSFNRRGYDVPLFSAVAHKRLHINKRSVLSPEHNKRTRQGLTCSGKQISPALFDEFLILIRLHSYRSQRRLYGASWIFLEFLAGSLRGAERFGIRGKQFAVVILFRPQLVLQVPNLPRERGGITFSRSAARVRFPFRAMQTCASFVIVYRFFSLLTARNRLFRWRCRRR